MEEHFVIVIVYDHPVFPCSLDASQWRTPFFLQINITSDESDLVFLHLEKISHSKSLEKIIQIYIFYSIQGYQNSPTTEDNLLYYSI